MDPHPFGRRPKRQRTPKTIPRDDSPRTYEKEHKRQEEIVTKEKVIEQVDGLNIFLRDQKQKLIDLRDQAKGQEHIVLLQLNGARLLEIPSGFEELVMKTVEPSRIVFGNQDWSRLDGPLADHIWCLHGKVPAFFNQMSLLDPVAKGECGLMTLQLFGVFLVKGDKEVEQDTKLMEAIQDPKAMRHFLLENLKNDIDYFKSSKFFSAMGRSPGLDDKYWKSEVEPSVTTFLKIDLARATDDEDGLMNMSLVGNKKRDFRHFLEVFAKATKTRIVFLHYWLPYKQFTCLDIDWRQCVPLPVVKFYEEIPDFGDGYDFYRTAIIMNAPTCTNVKGDKVMWNGEQRHFSMWLPHAYDPCTKRNRGSNARKQPPPKCVMVDDQKVSSHENLTFGDLEAMYEEELRLEAQRWNEERQLQMEEKQEWERIFMPLTDELATIHQRTKPLTQEVVGHDNGIEVISPAKKTQPARTGAKRKPKTSEVGPGDGEEVKKKPTGEDVIEVKKKLTGEDGNPETGPKTGTIANGTIDSASAQGKPKKGALIGKNSEPYKQKCAAGNKMMLAPVLTRCSKTYALFKARPIFELFPGSQIRIETDGMTTTAPIVDFAGGNLIYGNGKHFLTKQLTERNGKNVSKFYLQNTKSQWVQISSANWDDIWVKRIPNVSRIMTKGNVHVHGTMEDEKYRKLDSLPEMPVTCLQNTEKGKSVKCFFCEATIDPGSFGTISGNDFINILHSGRMSPKQKKWLQEHVRLEHEQMPYAFMCRLLPAAHVHDYSVRTLIQTFLFEVYEANPERLHPEVFERLYESRCDAVLKARLIHMLGMAAASGSKSINNVKKKTFYTEFVKAHRFSNSVSALQFLLHWIEAYITKISDAFIDFDFVAYLDCLEGNWQMMWNTFVIFFSRGMFFIDFPPLQGLGNVTASRNLISNWFGNDEITINAKVYDLLLDYCTNQATSSSR